MEGRSEPDSRTDLRPDRPRIFGIGLNKTGTSSFHRALTLLGFESLHWGGPPIHNAVKRAIDESAPLLSNIDPRFDAFSDIGLLSRRFNMLDHQYPGSRFVFTTRPKQEWISSRRRHVERNIVRKAAGEYDGIFLVVDEEKWSGEWDEHAERVHAYFDTRDNFLDFDLGRSPEWGPLCAFLGVAEPDAAFPWENRARPATVPAAPRRGRLQRWSANCRSWRRKT
jgi:hypothetical protein